MHMSDALVSPAVGGALLAASAAAIGFSVKKVTGKGFDEKKIPLMGIMGAFVFAGQMINFTIPFTGSSGHIGGGILLIQCLFFADGGLLAFGCNVVNMAVFSCLVAYPLIFRPLIRAGRGNISKKRLTAASILAVVTGLQLGAFGVVVETLASHVTELPFRTFLLLMQPIHLAIGLVEGVVTAAVLCFVRSARPELLESLSGFSRKTAPFAAKMSLKKILAAFAVATVLVGGGLSLFASAFPDGLEWAIEKTAGTADLERQGAAHARAADIVDKTAILPDYGYKADEGSSPAGTAFSGIVGSLITLLAAAALAFAIAAGSRLAARRVKKAYSGRS